MTSTNLVRKLTVTLTEEEWRKFLESQPRPVEWIVQQIQLLIREKAGSTPKSS